MSKKVKIPVELDLASLNASLKKLNTKLNREMSNIAKSMKNSFDGVSTATERVAKAQDKVSKASSKASKSMQDSYTKTGKTIEETMKKSARTSTKAIDDIAKSTEKATTSMSKSSKRAKKDVDALGDSVDDIAKSTETATDTIAKGSKKAKKDVDALGDSVDGLGDNTEKLPNKVKKSFEEITRNISTTMTKIGGVITDIGKKLTKTVSLPLSVAFASAIKSAMDFETALAKLSTVADTVSVPLEILASDIKELSNQTGISVNELTNNVYDAISAGQKTEDAVGFVANSTKLAKAGFAEAGQALDILTTILNSYGMTASDVTKVSDILINTQNKGKVTVGELASVMGKVIPTANSLGVNLEQVASGYAIMTSKGIKAAETTTYMNSMLNEMGKSGSVASDAIKNAFNGKSFQTLIAEGKTVGDVLAGLTKYAENTGLSLADMFGSAEAGKAALILATNEGKAFNDMLASMGDVAGATDEAFAKVSDTAQERFNKSLNKVKNSMIELGEKMLPIVSNFLDKFSVMVDKFAELPDETKESIVKFGLLAMVLPPLLTVFGKLTTGTGKFIGNIGKISELVKKLSTGKLTGLPAIFGKLGTSLGGVTKAIGLLSTSWVSVPLVVGAGAFAITKHAQNLEKKHNEAMAKISEGILNVEADTQRLAESTKTAIEKINNADMSLFGGNETYKKDLEATFKALNQYLTTGYGDIKKILDDMFTDIGNIVGNLSIEDKTNYGQFVSDLVNMLYKAGDLTEEEARKAQDRLNEILKLDVNIDFNLDKSKIQLQLNDVSNAIGKIFKESKGLFGWGFGIFKDTKLAQVGTKVYAELKNMEADITKFDPTQIHDLFNNIFDTKGLDKPKEKIAMLQELGKSMALFDPTSAVNAMHMFTEELGMTSADIDTFIQNTVSGFYQLDENTQQGIVSMLSSLAPVQDRANSIFEGMYAGLLDQSADFWGMMVAEQVKGQEDVNSAVADFQQNLIDSIKYIEIDEVEGTTAWLSDMLSTMQSQGALTKEQAQGIADGINTALSSIEGANAEFKVEIDTASVTDQIAGLDAQVRELTGKPYTAEVLLDPTVASQAAIEIANRINDIPGLTETEVQAQTSEAKKKLEKIIEQTSVLMARKQLNLNVSVTETTTKKTIVTAPVTAPAMASLDIPVSYAMPKIADLSANLRLTPITDKVNDVFTNLAKTKEGSVSNLVDFEKATQNINRKTITKASNSPLTAEKPTTIETILNLDGNMIARVVADKVDARNGVKYTANQRRFAY